MSTIDIEIYDKTWKILKKRCIHMTCRHSYVGAIEIRLHQTLIYGKDLEKYPTKKELHDLVMAALENFK